MSVAILAGVARKPVSRMAILIDLDGSDLWSFMIPMNSYDSWKLKFTIESSFVTVNIEKYLELTTNNSGAWLAGAGSGRSYVWSFGRPGASLAQCNEAPAG